MTAHLAHSIAKLRGHRPRLQEKAPLLWNSSARNENGQRTGNKSVITRPFEPPCNGVTR